MTAAAAGTDRPRILMVGPKAPPPGGVATVIQTIFDGDLATRFELRRLATNEHAWRPRGGLDRLLNRALCRTLGFDGFLALESGPQRRAIRAALDERPDLVHFHVACGYDTWLGVWMAREARRRGIASVFHAHGFTDVRDEHWSPVKRAAFRRGLRVPDRIVVLSDDLRRRFEPWVDAKRLSVVHNAVDVRRFRPSDAPPRADGSVRALFVGTYDAKQKGAYDILAVAPELVREAPVLRFVFVGRDVDDLEARFVRGTPLAPHCEFLGAKPASEMAACYADADLLVFPSYGEGLPIALLEAMASGLPIVATPVNAIPEVMRDPENGRFVAPGDRAALARAILDLVRDPVQRRQIGVANRRAAEARFDVAHQARALEAIYRELIERRSAP